MPGKYTMNVISRIMKYHSPYHVIVGDSTVDGPSSGYHIISSSEAHGSMSVYSFHYCLSISI